MIDIEAAKAMVPDDMEFIIDRIYESRGSCSQCKWLEKTLLEAECGHSGEMITSSPEDHFCADFSPKDTNDNS